MENNVKFSILLDLYGSLLTDKQYKLLDDYYNNDLSLSEIASNENITRQAVRDNLKKGENNLLEFEEKLKFMEKTLKQDKIINDTLEIIDKMNVNNLDSDMNKNVQKIEKNLNCLLTNK